MKPAFWIFFGAATQVFFLFTVYQLFAFLYGGCGDLLGIEPIPGSLTGCWGGIGAGSLASRIVLNLLLLAQFGIAHSFFLYPGVRSKIQRIMPDELYGSFYAAIASSTVLITASFWQPLPGVAYESNGIVAWLLLAGFLGSWVALFYSISLTGLGWQTGLTPWWVYVRGKALPRRTFVTTGAYRLLRHPIYLSFLGLMWFAPRMTSDHLLLASVWTVYVYIGSVLKDRRLLYFLGDRYRAYMASVPGYPLVPFGPLSRVQAGNCATKQP